MITKKTLFGIELRHYLGTSKKMKGEILNALERQTGMNRKSLVRAFRRLQLQDTRFTHHRGRTVYYTQDVVSALNEVWDAANRCCGELLHPVLSQYVEIFKRDDMWRYEEATTQKLLQISQATVKRHTTGWKCLGRKGISTTTPSAIKSRVPLFEGSWKDTTPGMGQADTVAHCGGSLAGEFIYSIGYVDVCTGWFIYRGQWGKSMNHTQESLSLIEKDLPWNMTMLHPDCGTEFLNQFVMKWCDEMHISVTRSRSYHKNDNGYIEQRNGHIARRWLGYDRLDQRELLPLLNEYYRLVCLYHNYFIPQRLCIHSEQLPNGKYRKRYENQAKTPLDRVLLRNDIDEDIKQRLVQDRLKYNPKLLVEKLRNMKYDILTENRRASLEFRFG